MEKATRKIVKISKDYIMICENGCFNCCKVKGHHVSHLKTFTDYSSGFDFLRKQMPLV